MDLAYNGSDFKIFYWTTSLWLFSVWFLLFWLLCSSHSSSCIVTYTKINLLVTSFKCRKNSVCRTSLSILFLHIDRSQNILSEYKNNKKFKSWILSNAKRLDSEISFQNLCVMLHLYLNFHKISVWNVWSCRKTSILPYRRINISNVVSIRDRFWCNTLLLLILIVNLHPKALNYERVMV